MKVRLVSDIHAEFQKFELPPIDGEHEAVLVVAGDLVPVAAWLKVHTHHVGLWADTAREVREWLVGVCRRHRAVIWVFGNHEYYDYHLTGAVEELRQHLGVGRGALKNLHILEQSAKVIDNVAFIGATTFVDFNNADPMAMYRGERGLNDFRLIWQEATHHAGPMSAQFMLDYHRESVAEIQRLLKRHRKRDCVVISHHAPSYLSIDGRYVTSNLNDCYASNLHRVMAEFKPAFWCHGHTHCSKRYMVDETMVLCNPRGYYDENYEFDGKFFFEVGGDDANMA